MSQMDKEYIHDIFIFLSHITVTNVCLKMHEKLGNEQNCISYLLWTRKLNGEKGDC